MICPNKQCLKDIPDESFFCDQCGKALKKCSHCAMLTTGNFCTKCGSPALPLAQTSISVVPKNQPIVEPITPTISGATTRMQANSLNLIHAGGEVLICMGETLLGRKVGPHAAYLSAHSSVSGQHGKIISNNGTWFYSDLGSTNGSKINGVQCITQKTYQLNAGTIIEMADQKFQVEIH